MVQELDGKTAKRSPQKTQSDLLGQYGKGLHLRLKNVKYRNTSSTDNSQMVCAAKAGVLQEVLANQFKKTKQGEALKVTE